VRRPAVGSERVRGAEAAACHCCCPAAPHLRPLTSRVGNILGSIMPQQSLSTASGSSGADASTRGRKGAPSSRQGAGLPQCCAKTLCALSAAGDQEMAEMVREEIAELTTQMDQQGEELKVLLLPSDPLDERNIMLEVRSGFFYAFHSARNVVIPSDCTIGLRMPTGLRPCWFRRHPRAQNLRVRNK